MRGVDRARDEDLGLQRVQAPAAHGRAQALATYPMPVPAQGNLQAAGPITAFVNAKNLHQGLFPDGRFLSYGPLLPRLPRIVPTGRRPEYLAEPPQGAVPVFGVDEAVTAYWSGVCQSLRLKQALAMALSKISDSCASRWARARSWRSSAAAAGSSAAPEAAATGV